MSFFQNIHFISTFLLTSDGLGRTGMFVALLNSIEQMNTEGAVNIFQIVKKMKEQ